MKDIEDIQLEAKKTVVAVSGGVDSMVLLDLFQRKLQPELIVVAHLNHGIRSSVETQADYEVVAQYCTIHGLQLVYQEAGLGPGSSEQQARNSRYAFLQNVLENEHATYIATAHHQDDVLETAIINLLRGTGVRGLSGAANRDTIIRPLLTWNKDDIISYAKHHNITWHEDSTNADLRYLRNYVRHEIIPKLQDSGELKKLKKITEQAREQRQEIAKIMSDIEGALIKRHDNMVCLQRRMFIQLDHAIACEVIRRVFDESGIRKVPERQLIDKLVAQAKTSKVGRSYDVSKTTRMCIDKEDICFLIQTS